MIYILYSVSILAVMYGTINDHYGIVWFSVAVNLIGFFTRAMEIAAAKKTTAKLSSNVNSDPKVN